MRGATSRALARLVAPITSDPVGFRVGLVALLLASATGLVAGLTLGALTGTLEELPGLLVLIPAASALRGSIFGALGSRLGTAIHAGVFRVTFERTSLVGQNAGAALVLSLVLSAIIAFVAKAVAVTFGVENTISIADFLVVSVLGGVVASVIVMVITVGVAALCAQQSWDLDNVAAPIVSSVGDVIALPSLFLATFLVGIDVVTPVLAAGCLVAAFVAGVVAWRSPRELPRVILRQSFPVLLVAGTVSAVAGAAVEQQAESFLVFPVFLVLVPPFLGLSGSLGGILASRLGTKLHLGLLAPRGLSLRPVGEDAALIAFFAVAAFTLLGFVGHGAAAAVGIETATLADSVLVMLGAGLLITIAVVVVAYSVALASHRLGVDPDNVGIPLVSSTLDLGGAFVLVLVMTLVGVT